MKILIKLLLVGIAFSTVISCNKFLDVTPDNIATLESSFANANETEAYLFGCYATLQQMGDIRYNPGFTSSGEIVFPIDLADKTTLGGSGGDAGFNLMRGLQNSANPLMNYWDGYNMGKNLWQAIRKCNTFLANVDIPLDLPVYKKKRWIAEAKFLKAYYHYWLIRMYGPIPIADKDLAVNASTDEVRQKQAPLDSCFNYVVGLLDQAAADLPDVIQNPAAEAGRITSVIALSLKANVLTTEASPLFNGNPDYASFKGKEGGNLFPVTTDPGKWSRAAAACKVAIEAAEKAGAKLYDLQLSGNIAHVSDSTKALLTIQGAVLDSWNPEQIWTLNSQYGWQYMTSPRVTTEAASNVFAVYSNFSVPLAETELFYSNHGVPIDQDKSWDFRNRYKLKEGDDDHGFYIKKGYQTAVGNFNREPRYYADISFDGALWFGSGNTDDRAGNYINAVNGPAAPTDRLRYNATGYWAKKLVPYQTTFGKNSVQENYYWPLLRLPALWLLYAECLNEVNGPTAEAYGWIDQVRARAGLQGVVDSWKQYSRTPDLPASKEGFRQIIHRERRIELAFEGQAGWDLRRWKELQSVLSGPFKGWNVFNRNTAAYHQVTTIYQPVFGLKDYLFPIQDYDLLTNPNLVQTPYW